jgi:FkbM family methyltransferase
MQRAVRRLFFPANLPSTVTVGVFIVPPSEPHGPSEAFTVHPSNEPTICRVLSRLRRQGLEANAILDVGASTGCWSNAVAGVYPEASFHLFEPLGRSHPDYVKDLEESLRRHPNFTLHPFALGAANRVIDLHVSPQPQGATTLEIPTSDFFPDVVPTPVRRLDDLVASGLVPSPQIMKLDVQGGEARILEGAGPVLDSLLVAQIECWLYPGYGPTTCLMHEVVERMAAHDLVAAEFSDPYYDARHQLTTLDLYFVRADRLDAWGGCL